MTQSSSGGNPPDTSTQAVTTQTPATPAPTTSVTQSSSGGNPPDTSTQAVTTQTPATPTPTTSVTQSSSGGNPPDTSTQAVTTQTPATPAPTPSTEPPTGNCPVPVGSPVFQAYDHKNQYLYVVRQIIIGVNFALIRYRGTLLDEQFGDCGVQVFTPQGLEGGFDITAGVLINEASGTHLYLTVSGYPAPALLDLNLNDNDASLSIHPAQVGNSQRFNTMVANKGRLYVAGVADDTVDDYGVNTENNALLGWFEHLTPNAFNDSGRGHGLALSPDASYLFVAGMNRENLFLRKYDLLSQTRETSFASNGEQVILDNVSRYSQQAAVFHQDRVYVASNIDRDQQLIIRRFDPETGEMDATFMVDEATPGFRRNAGSYRNILLRARRRARVELMANDEYLHVLKYGRDGHIFAATYDIRGTGQSLYRFTESPSFQNAADYGLAMTNGKIFLAFERPADNGAPLEAEIRIYEIPIPNLVVRAQRNTDSANNGIIWGSVVGVTTVAAMAAVVAIVGIGCYLVKHPRSESKYQPPVVHELSDTWDSMSRFHGTPQ